MGNVLIFAEHQGGHFPKTTLTAVHAGLDLAKKRGGKAIAVVAGDAPESAAGEIAKYGVAKVIALAHPALKNYLADAHAQALALDLDLGEVRLVEKLRELSDKVLFAQLRRPAVND